MRLHALALLVGLLAPLPATALELHWPLARVAHQTNESIELAVVRSGAAALAEGEMRVVVSGAAGKFDFAFAVPAVPFVGTEARRTEFVHLNGRLMRPGDYTIAVKVDGQATQAKIEVYSHLRRTSFKLVDWGSHAKGAEQAVLGENSIGFNTLLASFGGLSLDDVIRAGMDYMWCCTMSGGHQMDLRMECDWSDPLVLRGGTARVVRRAFQDRVNPNCIGVHFYDEPGLTWHKHPATGEFTPHGIPAQQRAYVAAFGKNPPEYHKVDPKNAKDRDDWLHWGRWKLSFMEAAWKDTAFGVHRVRSDFLSMNQAVYGWNAFTDGYYFNISRALPILGGHGGYDDFGALYFNPSWFLEFGRARDLARPNWYLPTWYEGTPPMRFRMEQYLSFMNNIQGMMKPPDMKVHKPASSSASDGIVESNKLMGRLGTIFTTMPVSRPPVAVLYSMSHNLRSQANDRGDNYEGAGHRSKTMVAYLAGQSIHQPLFPVVEEDILDGSLAAHHKAILLPGVHELDPRVIRALEQFQADGGTVLLSDDCKVAVKGALRVGAPIDTTFSDTLAKLWKENKQDEIAKFNTVGNMLKSNEKFAMALRWKLENLDIQPLVECDNPAIVVSRHGGGDVEYFFAVNTCYDAEMGDRMSRKGTTATLTLAGEGKQVYDAVSGRKPAEMSVFDGRWSGQVRFGPGQMRVFAITSEPIHVKLSRPNVKRDYTTEDAPLTLEAAVSVHGVTHLMGGSIPLQIRLIDPNGHVRYDLHRATKDGVCPISLPLAANDPPGAWELSVRELLDNDMQTLVFELAQPKSCGAAAGTVARALSFGNDRENVYRLFRTWKDVTIIKGTSDYHGAAIERIAKALAPWGVRFKVVEAASVKPRALTEEEAKTWIGLNPSKAKPGKDNPPNVVGYDLRGAVLLLGTPEDNPLIAFLQTEKFLPYTPKKGVLPGAGRGFIAWQRDALVADQESVALIAHDAAGMDEAAGTLAEIVAGLQPLMAKESPVNARVEFARPPEPIQQAVVKMLMKLPDRIVAFGFDGGAISADGTAARMGIQATANFRVRLPISGESTIAVGRTHGSTVAVASGSRWLMFEESQGKVTVEPMPIHSQRAAPASFVAKAALNDLTAIGTKDGSLSLFDGKGNRRWKIETQMDPKIPANPYLAGAFARPEDDLVVVSASELHLIDARNGRVKMRMPGFNGKLGIHQWREHFLVADGANIRWFSGLTYKFERSMPLPPGGLIGFMPESEDRILVATEDGSTRLLHFTTNGEKPTVAWHHQAPRLIPKFFKPLQKGYAVAYWGGTLHLLDQVGKLRAGTTFEYDVTALAGHNDLALVGLADGSVFSVK